MKKTKPGSNGAQYVETMRYCTPQVYDNQEDRRVVTQLGGASTCKIRRIYLYGDIEYVHIIGLWRKVYRDELGLTSIFLN